MIEVPEMVRAKAVAFGADAWLAALPSVVRSLEDDWSIVVGRAFAGGSEAFVAETTGADGTPAVLRVLMPQGDDVASGHSREATTLRLAGGDGCAELYRDDAERGALLMERLGPSMYSLGLPLTRRLELLCDTAARVWRPAGDSGLPTGAAKARWLADFIVTAWTDLDRPCSRQVIDHALRCAERRERAHRDERSVLVHGDVHQLNALQSGDGFKLVDPDGLLAEAEYDLGVIMRGDPVELLDGDPVDRAVWLAERTGLDAVATWEWGVVERVSTGLLCTRIGMQPFGSDSLRTAEAVVDVEFG